MKRRIVKQGNATLTISLPASWTKLQGLHDKDEIEVEEKDTSLVITTTKHYTPKTLAIDFTGFSKDLIIRYLYSLYKQGYEELEITFSDVTFDKKNKRIDTLRFIQETITHLFGVEIVDQKKNFCRIKDLTGIVEDEFERMLSRILFSFSTLIASCKEYLQKKTAYDDIRYQQEVIEKFSVYCHRLLNKRNYPKATLYYNFISDLKFSADIISFLAREIHEYDLKVSLGEVTIFGQVAELFTKIFEVYHRFNRDRLMDIISMRRKIYEHINQIKLKENSLVAIRISSLLGLMPNLIENLLGIKI